MIEGALLTSEDEEPLEQIACLTQSEILKNEMPDEEADLLYSVNQHSIAPRPQV